MDDKILFIQKAVSLNFLKQSVLVEFFQQNSFAGIPDNIDKILLEKNILTKEQIAIIHEKIAFPGPSVSVRCSVTLSLSGGKLIDIDIPELSSKDSFNEEDFSAKTNVLGDAISSAKTLDFTTESSAKTLDFTTQKDKTPQVKDFSGREILLDKYRIISKLGQGGMGAVYKVEHMLLQNNKFFALKVMHPMLAHNENAYKRFVREVELAMSLTHKHIISVREFGNLPDNLGPYLTMDFSEGFSLEEVLKEDWECDIERSFYITCQILQGLEEAHAKNIVHRDLKPANILIEQDEDGNDFVKIVDFGLAKLIESSNEPITHGTVGTPYYMSPEQAGGEKVDQRADIYSVGIILYEMVTGKVPFQSETLRKLLTKQIFEKPPAPSQFRSDLPQDLEAIILKTLEKEPAARYKTATDLLKALEEFGEKQSTNMPLYNNTRYALLSAITVILAVFFAFGGIFIGENSTKKTKKTQKEIAEKQSSYEKTKKKVEKQHQQKKYQKGIKLWKTYLKKHPKTPFKKHIETEIKKLKSVQNKKEHDFFLKQAQESYQQKNFSQAILFLKQAQEAYLNDPKTFLLLGLSYAHKKNYSQALPFLEKSTFYSFDALNELVKIYIAQKKIQKAIDAVENCLKGYQKQKRKPDITKALSLLEKLHKKKKLGIQEQK